MCLLDKNQHIQQIECLTSIDQDQLSLLNKHGNFSGLFFLMHWTSFEFFSNVFVCRLQESNSGLPYHNLTQTATPNVRTSPCQLHLNIQLHNSKCAPDRDSGINLPLGLVLRFPILTPPSTTLNEIEYDKEALKAPPLSASTTQRQLHVSTHKKTRRTTMSNHCI